MANLDPVASDFLRVECKQAALGQIPLKQADYENQTRLNQSPPVECVGDNGLVGSRSVWKGELTNRLQFNVPGGLVKALADFLCTK